MGLRRMMKAAAKKVVNQVPGYGELRSWGVQENKAGRKIRGYKKGGTVKLNKGNVLNKGE